VVEALCAGLMVLVHDCPHFKWLVQDEDCLVDMSVPGNLTTRLRELFARRKNLCNGSQQRAATASQRFDWNSVAPAYAEMYRKVASLKSFSADTQ
jgi:glycosyltransferase involved in cell wall biosynthesis